jgi:hypothetical protein
MVISLILTACGNQTTVANPPSFTGVRIDNSETVSEGEYITFYRGKQETVLVEISLSNPSNVPIRSVKINGYTYIATKFTEESTNSLLYFYLNVGSDLADTVYTVDQISYLDGDNTINVPVTTDNGFKIYVYKDLPTVERENYLLSRDALSIDFNITDIDSIIEPNKLFAELYSGETRIQEVELNSGFINVEFTGLLANRLYEVKIVADYDRDDNNGLQEKVVLYNGTYSTLSNGLPSASIINLDITSNLVTFDVDFTDIDEVVVPGGLRVAIFDGDDVVDELTFAGTITGLHFEDLLNDKEYQLKVLADYDLLDGLGVREENVLAVSTFSTLPRQVPTPVLERMKLLENSIDFDIEIEDQTGIIDVTSLVANLYLEGEFVHSVEIVNYHVDFQVNNLFANNEFTIELVADYDLNDGLGVQEDKIIFSETYSTSANERPTINVEELIVEQGYVTVLLDVFDNNSTLMGAIEVALIENDQKVDSIFIDVETEDIVFDYATKSGFSYYIEFIADYNLKDGSGAVYDQVLRRVVAYTAEAKAPIAEISEIETTTSSITFDMTITDADNTTIENHTIVYLIYGDIAIAQRAVPVGTTSVTFTGLLSNNQYNVIVESDYNLDDGSGILENQELLDVDILTNTKTAPTSEITNIQKDDESISIDVEIIDPDLVVDDTEIYVKLIHEGSEIQSQAINNGENFGITFSGLLSDNNYTIEVYVDYDLDDGNGVVEDQLVGEQVITTSPKAPPVATFVFTESDQVSITADIRIEDEFGVLFPTGDLKAVLMYDDTPTGEEYDLSVGLNSNIVFNTVFANERYYIDIVADYDLNDGNPVIEDEILASDFVVTTEFEDITGFISNATSTTDSITLDVLVTDPSAVITGNLQAVLYIDDTPTGDVQPLVVGENLGVTFTGINSNTTYTVQVETDYNNNEIDSPVTGGLLDLVVIATLPLSPPSVSITQIEPAKSSITVGINVVDTYSVGSDFWAKLYKDDVATGEEYALTVGANIVTFTNSILSNNEYEIRVFGDYNLLDSATVEDDYLFDSQVVTTVAKEVPEILISNLDQTFDSIYLDFELVDNDGVLETGILTAGLYVDNTLVTEKTLTTDSVTFDLTGFQAGFDFEIRFSADYDLTDGNGIVSNGLIRALPYTTLSYIVPTARFNNTIATQTGIISNIDITDPDGRIVEGLEAHIYNEAGTLLDTQTLVVGNNIVTFNVIADPEEFYHIEVEADYDLLDGELEQDDVVLSENLFLTNSDIIPEATIDNVVTTKTTIQFDANVLDVDGTITTPIIAHLYQNGTATGDTITLTTGSQTETFTGLLSGVEYAIVITVDYNVNDGNGDYRNYQMTSANATTIALLAPSASIVVETVNIDTIIVDVTVVDNDTVTTARSAVLYDIQGTELAREALTIGFNNNVTFDTLFSNETYTIRIESDYDLSNGGAALEDVPLVSQDIMTSSLTAPASQIEDGTILVTSSTIEFTVISEDPLATLTSPLQAIIYNDGTEVNRVDVGLGTQSIQFDTLDSDTEFYIIIQGNYDLNLKTGPVVEETLDFTYVRTNPRVKPIVTVTNEEINHHEVTFDIDVDDIDNVLETGVITAGLYVSDVLVDETELDTNTVYFDLSGFLADFDFEVRITADYDLDNGDGVQTDGLLLSIDFTTLPYLPPTAVFNDIIATQQGIVATITVTDTENRSTGNLEAILYDNLGAPIGAPIALNAGENEITFPQIAEPETFYRIVVESDYDLLDGNNVLTDQELAEGALLTYHDLAPEAELDEATVIITETSLTVDIDLYDTDGTITGNMYAQLYLDGAYVSQEAIVVGSNTEVFNSLYSNREYEVRIVVDYDNGDGNNTYSDTVLATAFFTTEAYTEPNAEIIVDTLQPTQIIVDVIVEDPDLRSTVRVLNLYDQYGTLLDTETLTVGDNYNVTFSGLDGLTEYTLTAFITSDLNDGDFSVVREVATLDVSTVSFISPEATINGTTSTTKTVTVDFELLDDDNATTERWLRLYNESDTMIQEHAITAGEEQSYTFDNVPPAASYTVRVEVTYDLADNNGVQNDVVLDSFDAATESYVSFDYLDTDIGKDGATIDVVVEDNENINSGMIMVATLYQGVTEIGSYIVTTDTATTLSMINLLSDFEYTIEVEATFDVGDGNGDVTEVIATESFTTEPMARPEVTIDAFSEWTIGGTVQLEIDFGNDDDNVASDTGWTAYLYVDGVEVDDVDIDSSYAGNPETNTDVPIDFTGYTVVGGESFTVVVTAMVDYNEVAGQGEVETAVDSVAGIDAGN